MQPTHMTLRQVLQQSDQVVARIHFPTTGLISLMTVLEEEEPVEAGIVGRQGFVGMAATLGIETSPHRALCQMGGDTWRMPLAPFMSVMRNSPDLTGTINRCIAFSLRIV